MSLGILTKSGYQIAKTFIEKIRFQSQLIPSEGKDVWSGASMTLRAEPSGALARILMGEHTWLGCLIIIFIFILFHSFTPHGTAYSAAASH